MGFFAFVPLIWLIILCGFQMGKESHSWDTGLWVIKSLKEVLGGWNWQRQGMGPQ